MKAIFAKKLQLRFYLSEGWTKEELENCCVLGRVKTVHIDDEEPFFAFENGTHFNAYMLLTKSSRIVRQDLGIAYEKETDLQFLSRHNEL